MIMKSKLLKCALPIGLGLTLLSITIFGLLSTTLAGCTKKQHIQWCTNSAYPNYCPNENYCCPSGFHYYCDGGCDEQPCPHGTPHQDYCAVEQ